MSAPEFLDTNVLVYAYDAASPRKQRIAQQLVRKAFSGEALSSTQALGELAATLLHKVTPRARPEDVMAVLDALGPMPLIATNADTVRRAVEARARYGIHFYDGLIVAAAEQAGCKQIWSEDLNPGQRYFDILVENPFA